jgi:hypothetical protein
MLFELEMVRGPHTDRRYLITASDELSSVVLRKFVNTPVPGTLTFEMVRSQEGCIAPTAPSRPRSKYPPAKPGALVVSRSKRPLDVTAARPLGPPYGCLR